MFVYVGIALVAVTALPVHDGQTELGDALSQRPGDRDRRADAPALAGADAHATWSAALATLTLVAAANSAMLGLSRLAYSLSTNRQIPSGLGRLHPQRSTPYVLIILAGLIAAALVVPEDLDFLVGIYAFGAMLAFTIAHLSICRLRYSEPDRDRPYRMPLSVARARRRAAAAGRVRRARLGRRLGGGDGRARTRALRRARLDGRAGSRCT